MVKRKTLDKNGEEKNTGLKWLGEKHVTKMVKRKTWDKNSEEKNTGQKW